MTYAVVFVSRTGNTRRLAEAIPPALGREACCYFGPPSDEALRADWIFAGFGPTGATAAMRWPPFSPE